MKNKLLQIIYIFSFLPIIVGSTTFFYWYYKRIWFAENAEIEIFALFTILGFFLLTLINIILCVIYVIRNASEWKMIIAPVLIILMTFQVINLYGNIYDSFSNKAFILITNDTNQKIDRIWSDNFEFTLAEDMSSNFVISFYPVYTYDWSVKSSGGFNYEVNPLYVDVDLKDDSIVTYRFPEISKGDCLKFKLSELTPSAPKHM